MSFTIDTQLIRRVIAELSSIPSPTGMAAAAVDYMDKEFKQLGLETRRTARGALCCDLPGDHSGPRLTLTAHADTLGAMVRGIRSDGRLNLFAIGSYSWNTMDGEYVLVHTREGKQFRGTCLPACASVHVFPRDQIEKAKGYKDMEVRLDEAVTSREDVEKLGIRVGDFVSFDARVEVLNNGFVKARFLDDKAGVTALLAALAAWKNQDRTFPRPVSFHVGCHEETGGGVTGIPADTRELVALDMGVMGGEHAGDERKVSICPMDSTGPYDRDLFVHMTKLAEQGKIPHAVDIFLQYGSDASAAARTGLDARTGLIGPGVHASHSVERTHIEGITAAAQLALTVAFHPLAG